MINDRNRNRLMQFVRFACVGFSNTAISYGVYAGMVFLGAHYQIANIVSFIISSLNGFILNKLWVFKASEKTKEQVIKYYAVYAASFALSLFLSWLLIDVIGVNEYLAPAFCLLVTVPLNFFLSKYWIYAK